MNSKFFKRLGSFTIAVSLALMVQVGPAMAQESLRFTVRETSIEVTSLEAGGEVSTLSKLEQSGTPVQIEDNFEIAAGKVDHNSIQLIISIDSPSAPQKYRFTVDGVSSFRQITLGDTLLYAGIDESGAIVAWLAPPWANDSQGIPVATRFEFDGNVITQVVDLNSQLAYPVTADPYLGLNLIDDAKLLYVPNHVEPTLSVAVTPFLGMIYFQTMIPPLNYSIARNIAETYGWPEVHSKLTSKYGIWASNYVRTKTTYWNQYQCHAMGAPAIFVATAIGFDPNPTWDLEGYRPPSSSAALWITSRCNW